MTITRSEGTPLPGITGLVAGGGYRGCTEELDALVALAAGLLAGAYGSDIEIRYNSDRESGGAWLKTPDGYSAHVGIWAELTTARKRAVWERFAAKSEIMAGVPLGSRARVMMRPHPFLSWRAHPALCLTCGKRRLRLVHFRYRA